MKSIKIRTLSLLLSIVMLCSAIPAVSAYSGVSDWAVERIEAMDQLGLIPETLADSDLSKNMTRLDMCKTAMLAYTKITGSTPELPSEHPFSDTTDPAVEQAYAIGLVSGNDGKFRPDDTLIRAEFFCIVTTFLKLTGYPISQQDKDDLSSFDDASSLPNWATEHTQIAVGMGIVAGTGNALSWKKDTSAQEALAMFLKAYTYGTNIPDESTPPAPEVPDFINLAKWAADSVYKMADLGLIPDEVRSTPMNGSITRTNMCKIIMLAYKQIMGVRDEDLPAVENPFSDTSDTDVLNAYQLGLVKGKGNGIFGADDPISRQDFFTIAAKFLNTVGYDLEDDRSIDLSTFHDSDDLASYAAAPARVLISIGALAGDSNQNLNPRNSIVCQESLCIFYKIHLFITNWIDSSGDDRTEEAKEKAAAVVKFAKTLLDCDYAYGGTSPETGFDCSGFVYYVYKQFGYTLQPGAWNQWDLLGKEIPRSRLLPGDLVFFSDDGTPSGMSHVAIYIGDDQIIHASTPSTGVIISDLTEPYYVREYLGAKRVIK